MVAEEADYKEAKERFVSGLEGTRLVEVQLLINVVAVGVWVGLRHRPRQGRVRQFLIEFACVAVPAIAAVTKPEWILVVFLVLAGLGWAPSLLRTSTSSSKSLAGDPSRPLHVSIFRFSLMLLTCLMILAIDFPVTPRRLGKAETYGTGLMDVGTGGFVMSSGVVEGLKQRQSRREASRMWAAIVRAAPLALLGLIRFIMVRSTGYQEVVMEYGVHWNFFFTLAAVMVGTQAIKSAAGESILLQHPGAFGVGLAVLYQLALGAGLEEWILHAPREGFLSMNKEGVCSIVGYIALYWIAIALGQQHTHVRTSARSVHSLFRHVGILGFLFWVLLVSEQAFGRISRRLANLPYIVWITCCCEQILVVSMVLLLASSRDKIPLNEDATMLLRSVTKHQLTVFLFANLLTGACNLVIDTLRVPDTYAIMLLSAYMFLLSIAAVLLDHNHSKMQ